MDSSLHNLSLAAEQGDKWRREVAPHTHQAQASSWDDERVKGNFMQSWCTTPTIYFSFLNMSLCAGQIEQIYNLDYWFRIGEEHTSDWCQQKGWTQSRIQSKASKVHLDTLETNC